MINKLEMLIALAAEQHFARAADRLGITQPSLSAGLKQLEDNLGVRLVNRGTRFGGLTPEGQRALELARQIVGDARRLRDEMRAGKDGLSGQIRLGVIPTALTAAAALTAEFSKCHPMVNFVILSRASHEILSMFGSLDLDIGFTYLRNEPLGNMDAVPIYDEEFVAICHKSCALSQKPSISWAELSQQKLCLLTPDMQNRRIIDSQFVAAGKTPRPMVETNSTLVLISHVVHSKWVTVLPRSTAAFLTLGHDLVMIPLQGSTGNYQVGIIAPHQAPQVPTISAFLDFAANEFQFSDMLEMH